MTFYSSEILRNLVCRLDQEGREWVDVQILSHLSVCSGGEVVGSRDPFSAPPLSSEGPLSPQLLRQSLVAIGHPKVMSLPLDPCGRAQPRRRTPVFSVGFLLR